MKFSALVAIAVMFTSVEAVELHSHQKVASGAHMRREAAPAALAQSESEAKRFNMAKMKAKAKQAKKFAKEKAAEVKADAANIKSSVQSGDYAGALDSAKGDFTDLSGDAKGAADWGKQAAADVQE